MHKIIIQSGQIVLDKLGQKWKIEKGDQLIMKEEPIDSWTSTIIPTETNSFYSIYTNEISRFAEEMNEFQEELEEIRWKLQSIGNKASKAGYRNVEDEIKKVYKMLPSEAGFTLALRVLEEKFKEGI